MRAVLISIRPEWCHKIVSGEKTIEVRKSSPKLSTPFKCYIYCTYGRGLIEAKDTVHPNLLLDQTVDKVRIWGNCCNGKVIGEFVCDGIYAVLKHPDVFAGHPLFFEKAIQDACLTERDVEKYSGGKDLFGWHMSDLKIYDKPMELRELQKPDDKKSFWYRDISLVRPPQSWCYVEELP